MHKLLIAVHSPNNFINFASIAMKFGSEVFTTCYCGFDSECANFSRKNMIHQSTSFVFFILGKINTSL